MREGERQGTITTLLGTFWCVFGLVSSYQNTVEFNGRTYLLHFDWKTSIVPYNESSTVKRSASELWNEDFKFHKHGLFLKCSCSISIVLEVSASEMFKINALGMSMTV